MVLRTRGGWRQKAGDYPRYWDAALRVLQKIDPNLVLTRLPWRERMLARLRLWFGTEKRVDEWLNGRRPTHREVVAGVAAPLKEEYGESKAFGLQLRVLEYAIQLRKAVYRGHLLLGEMPQSPESERAQLSPGSIDTVRSFMASIEEARLPSEAAEDIIADYWNKLAFVAWEAAQLERGEDRDPWLKQAREYIDIALKGRPNWTPGQLNLARVSASEGNIEQALKTLERILGKEKKPKSSGRWGAN
jgi:hypothetical protein